MSSLPVVNASPLIYLAHADLIDLLQVAGSSIVVPRTVAEEIRRRGSQDPTARALQTTPWLREVDPVSPSQRVLTWRPPKIIDRALALVNE